MERIESQEIPKSKSRLRDVETLILENSDALTLETLNPLFKP